MSFANQIPSEVPVAMPAEAFNRWEAAECEPANEIAGVVDAVRAGDPQAAVAILEQLDPDTLDDIGAAPVDFLFAALAYYRLGQQEEASQYLFDAMLRNVYLLPYVYSGKLLHVGLRPSSEWERREYPLQVAHLLAAVTPDERRWIKEQYSSILFSRLRVKYIDCHG